MLNPNFAILGGILPIIACASYASDVLKNKTQPNRVSWILWCVAPLIAFSAEIVKHTSLRVALLTFAVGFGPLMVVAASFVNKKAYWKITRFDIFCGLISVLALALWAITRQGDVAIVFSILADLFAAIPTVIKSCSHPKSESGWPYALNAVGAGLTLLTIKVWVFSTYGFVSYIFVITAVISLLVLLPRPQKVTLKT